MAATTHTDARAAIIARIVANWDAAAVPVHWPATRFTPPLEKHWIRPRVVFTNAEQATLGVTGLNRISGDLNVAIFAPIGAGNAAALGYAEDIRALFPRGLVLSTTGRKAFFEVPEVLPEIEEEEWLQIPVRCPFSINEVN